MKVYLCNEVVRTLDFAQQCRFARLTGYDGLEVAPFTLSDDPASLTPAKLRELRDIAEGEGVPVAGLHWLMAAPAGLSITALDPEIWQATADFGRHLLDICAGLGGRYLVHGSPAQRLVAAEDPDASRQRGVAYFDIVGAAAQGHGLTYVIEPLSRLDTGFVNRPAEAREIIATLKHDSLKTMIDCYAVAANGERPEDAVMAEVPKGDIFHLHLNDTNKRGPGEGQTDFAAVIDNLAKVEYAGSLAIEPFDYQPDGPSCAARAIGYTRGLIQASKGW